MRGGLVGGAFEHGGEAEEVAVLGSSTRTSCPSSSTMRDVDGAGEDDVGSARRLRRPCRCAARGEVAQLDLCGEDGELVVVEQGEERNVAKFFGFAGHSGVS